MLGSLIEALKRRKVLQWSLGYLAVAWVLLQFVGFVVGAFEWPVVAVRVATVLAGFGFLSVIVAAWHHGERGPQAPTRIELALQVALVIAAGASALWVIQHAPGARGGGTDDALERTVVVLPVTVIGNDPELVASAAEFEADLTDDLASAAIRLVPRARLAPVLGQPLDQILDAIGATHAIEATLRAKGDEISLSWSLIGGSPPRELWTSMAFAATHKTLEAELAGASFNIAGDVRYLLGPLDWITTGSPLTRSPSALEDFRRANLAARNNDLHKATQLLDTALQADPEFVLAHALRASVLSFGQVGSDSESRLDQAKASIERAKALAPGLPEVALAEATLAYFGASDPKRARAIMAPVQAVLPPSVGRNVLMSYLLRNEGRLTEALAEVEHLIEVDPHHSWAYLEAAALQGALRRFPAAERTWLAYGIHWYTPDGKRGPAWYRFMVHGDPRRLKAELAVAEAEIARLGLIEDDESARSARFQATLMFGDIDGAIRGLAEHPAPKLGRAGMAPQFDAPNDVQLLRAALLKIAGRTREAQSVLAQRHPALDAALAKDPDDTNNQVHLAWHDAVAGRAVEARKGIAPVVAKLEAGSIESAGYRNQLYSKAALVLAWSGDADGALAMLERSLAEPFGTHYARLANDPCWTPLHKDPRFVKLLAEHGFAVQTASRR